MQENTSSDELLRQLSTAVLPTEDAAHARARRERVVPRLAAMVEGLPAKLERRRRFARGAAFASAAALLLVAGLAFKELRPHAGVVVHSTPSSAVVALEGAVQIIRSPADSVASSTERVSVSGADEVVTAAEGRARAWLASGAEVEIAPESRVRLVGERKGSPSTATSEMGDEAVVLGAGRVTVHVPKLGPQRTFAVQTPEATVIVHGTVFSVERTTLPGEAIPRTTVGVTEGSVAVQHDGAEVLLHAGDRWSSGSLIAHEDERPPQVERVTSAPDRAPNRSKSNAPVQQAGRETSKGTDASDKSSLAAENRLLQEAMAARQQGDARRAAQLANELVTRYPASPLVEEARVERMRALMGAGASAAAAAEARSYLRDYPQGFARQEASRILANGPR